LTDTTHNGVEEAQGAYSSFAIYSRRAAQIMAIAAALVTLYIEGATAYLNTQEAIKAKAAADNASQRRHGEAVQAEEQARAQLEVARNAADRMKGEADKAEAEAKKAESEAITAKSTAKYAPQKTAADAEVIKAEAELKRQKGLVALETARNAERKEAADAVKAEQDVIAVKRANALLRQYSR